MVRRYLVTGLAGQVVRSLVERGRHRSDVEILPIGRPALDLANLSTIESAIRAARPELIISAAAYTAVDLAEVEGANAFIINAEAVGEIGRIAHLLHIPVVHLSTDYVFDGHKSSPYTEDDAANPLGVYGRSKLEGEKRLVASRADCTILRAAWVHSPFGNNFISTMMRLAGTRPEVKVVGDQVGNPTSALDLADAILKVATNLLTSRDERYRGIFHLAASGSASRADLAREIFSVSRSLGGPFANVTSIATSDYPTPAERPQNSCLNCSRIASVHNVHIDNWKIGVREVVGRLLT